VLEVQAVLLLATEVILYFQQLPQLEAVEAAILQFRLVLQVVLVEQDKEIQVTMVLAQQGPLIKVTLVAMVLIQLQTDI
jgi:hypothetical protein